MTALHVREQGAVVRKDGERIIVTRTEKETHNANDAKKPIEKRVTLMGAPIRDLTQVAVYGYIQVTTQAVGLLLEHDVDLVFLSMYGKFRGRLTKSGSKFARLRHDQLRLTSDDGRSLAVAKQIVRAKLANQRNLLQELAQFNAYAPASARLQRSAREIDQMYRASVRATDSDTLRGFEGRAGASYFEAIKAMLPANWNFSGRNYYPALDPFNALLSFGYSLLMKDCSAAIQLVGLDPYLGCFHALEYDRPSLTLDLMEEFRPLVVDQTMLALVREKAIAPTDFKETKRKNRPIELGEPLITKVIEAYEQRLNESIRHMPSRTEVPLRRCLTLQAQLYARVITGERAEYEGVVV